MVTINDEGRLMVTSNPADGSEWLLRMRSIIRLVQCVDEQRMCKDEIYHALSVVEDMLPEEDEAYDIWRSIRDKRREEQSPKEYPFKEVSVG